MADPAPLKYYDIFMGVEAAGADSCTSGLLFSWHCENVNVTVGTPAGCSVGDTTATANSSAAINNDHTAQDGSYHLDFPSTYDRYMFDVSSEDIVKLSAGTVIFYFKYQTFAGGDNIWTAYVDTSNLISVKMLGTTEVQITYSGTGGGTNRVASTTAAAMSSNTWYKITAKWSVAGVSESGTQYLSIDVDDANRVYNANALPTVSGSLGANSFRVGDWTGSGTYDAQVDNIKVYDSWLTTP